MSFSHFPSLLFTVTATVLVSSVAAQSDPLLDAPWRAFDTGDFPTFAPTNMATGDIDSDGDLDLVIAREFFGRPGLTVLRSNGDGSYAPEEIYELPHSKDLAEVALGDIDGDGDLDAVATLPGSSGIDFRVVIWRNQGDGTFGTRTEMFVREGPVGLLLEDFTGDGFADIVTANYGYVAGPEDTISLLVHNGLAGAQAGFLPAVHTTVADNCYRLDAADVDGDGDLDLAVGRYHGNGAGVDGTEILFNDGNGSFTGQTHYAAIPNAYRQSPAVALVDMDLDGDPDLLAAGGTAGSPSYGLISIRRNNGSGIFGNPQVLNLADWTFTPHTIATPDLNSDGWPDILVSTPSGRASDGFNVILSNGSGGFDQAVRHDAGKSTHDLAGIDVDGDGDLDVLTVANDSSVVTVHMNTGNGTFAEPTRNTVGVLTRDMVRGDIDQDGDLDLVSGGSSDVHILRNNGDGTFPVAEPYDSPFTPGDILLADMNNDGCLDLVMRSYNFAVALNDCKGSFLPAVVTSVGSSQSGEVGAFDLDNDGFLDIIATDPGPSSAVYLFRNNGDGVSFSFMNVISGDGHPYGVGGGDLNHDGNIDLIFNNALGLTVYLGRGDFTVAGPFPTASYGYPFEVADLNNDGHLDLAFKAPEPSFGITGVGTMEGFGDGSFGFALFYPGPNGRESAFRVVSDVDVNDINGDGNLDVVFTNNAPNDVSIFLGNGDMTLQEQDRYGAGYGASDSAVGDFNGDGRVDVATVVSIAPSGLGNAVVVLPNVAAGAITDATLTDVTRTLGIHVAGGVAELLSSDDTYYILKSGPGFDPTEPHPAQADVGFDTGGASASTLNVMLEEHANIGGPTAVVLLRNWDASSWDEIGRAGLSPADQSLTFGPISASGYISRAARLKVRVRTFAVLVLDPQVRGVFSHDLVAVQMQQ